MLLKSQEVLRLLASPVSEYLMIVLKDLRLETP